MSQKVRNVLARARTVMKPYTFVCKNPFHDAWSSSDSRKANPGLSVRANLLQVLSAVAGMTVAAICRACKDQADSRIEITSHALFQAVSLLVFVNGSFCVSGDFDTFSPVCLSEPARGRRYTYRPRIKDRWFYLRANS